MSLRGDIDDMVMPVVNMFHETIRGVMEGHLARVYLNGDMQVFEWARTKFTDKPIFYEGLPMNEALKFAHERAAELITEMGQETKDRIARIIEDGIENKRGIDGLTRDIIKGCQEMGYNPMGISRAEMIARTETCGALEQAFMDRSKALGITGKEWVVTEPCDICKENGQAGAIPMKDEFPSGDLRPPAHPNCRCALAPVMLETAEPEKPKEKPEKQPNVPLKKTNDLWDFTPANINEPVIGRVYPKTKVEYSVGVNPSVQKAMGEALDKMPVGVKNSMSKIKFNSGLPPPELGKIYNLGQGWSVAGVSSGSEVELFTVNNRGLSQLARTLGHEAGHSAYHTGHISSVLYKQFANATAIEGRITSYSQTVYAKNAAWGVQENFAEWFAAMATKTSEWNLPLSELAVRYPKSFKIISRQWAALGGQP